MLSNIKTNAEIFVAGSTYARHALKRRIKKDKLIEYHCLECKNPGEWNGKPLSLQLEHKNGVNNDNRLENLAFICPNCHSQTETYAGKNSKGMRSKDKPPSYRVAKLSRDKELWDQVKNDPTVRLAEWGAQVRIADRLGISSQKVRQWLARVDPGYQI